MESSRRSIYEAAPANCRHLLRLTSGPSLFSLLALLPAATAQSGDLQNATASPHQSSSSQYPPVVQLTAEQDHQRTMDLLHMTTMGSFKPRPGAPPMAVYPGPTWQQQLLAAPASTTLTTTLARPSTN
jgi:hypothetical protein